MRLNEVLGITLYDLKTWGFVSIMTVSLLSFEIFLFHCQATHNIPAHIVLVFMFFACFYSQGFLGGIVVTRWTIKEERESEC